MNFPPTYVTDSHTHRLILQAPMYDYGILFHCSCKFCTRILGTVATKTVDDCPNKSCASKLTPHWGSFWQTVLEMAESLSQSQRSVRGAHSRSASRVKSTFSTSPHSPTLKRRDYAIGICLLLIVVFLWTSSNFITQASHDPWTTSSVTRRLFAPGSIWCGVQQTILVCAIASRPVCSL